MLNFEAYVNLGVKTCRKAQRDGMEYDAEFLSFLLGMRRSVEVIVTERYPEFGVVLDFSDKATDKINSTGDFTGLVSEFDKISEFIDDERILHDVYYLALTAGMAGFMSRGESTENNDANLALRLLETRVEELEGIPALCMVSIGMWFSNYKGYKEHVLSSM